MKGRIPRVGALVLVVWDDAVNHGSQVLDVRDPDVDRCLLETVGWIVRRTRASLFVSPERGPDFSEGRHRWTMRIPLGMVRSVTRIA